LFYWIQLLKVFKHYFQGFAMSLKISGHSGFISFPKVTGSSPSVGIWTIPKKGELKVAVLHKLNLWQRLTKLLFGAVFIKLPSKPNETSTYLHVKKKELQNFDKTSKSAVHFLQSIVNKDPPPSLLFSSEITDSVKKAVFPHAREFITGALTHGIYKKSLSTDDGKKIVICKKENNVYAISLKDQYAPSVSVKAQATIEPYRESLFQDSMSKGSSQIFLIINGSPKIVICDHEGIISLQDPIVNASNTTQLRPESVNNLLLKANKNNFSSIVEDDENATVNALCTKNNDGSFSIQASRFDKKRVPSALEKQFQPYIDNLKSDAKAHGSSRKLVQIENTPEFLVCNQNGAMYLQAPMLHVEEDTALSSENLFDLLLEAEKKGFSIRFKERSSATDVITCTKNTDKSFSSNVSTVHYDATVAPDVKKYVHKELYQLLRDADSHDKIVIPMPPKLPTKVIFFTKVDNNNFSVTTTTSSLGGHVDQSLHRLIPEIFSDAVAQGTASRSQRLSDGREATIFCFRTNTGSFRALATTLPPIPNPSLTNTVRSKLPQLLFLADTSSTGIANDFISEGNALYSLTCKKEPNGEISTTILEVSQRLENTFATSETDRYAAARYISTVIAKEFPRLAAIAKAAAEGRQIEKGSRRLYFDFQGRTYTIKCIFKPDGTYAIEAAGILGEGSFKQIRKELDVAGSVHACIMAKIKKDRINKSLAGKQESQHRTLLSEELRKELENMQLFAGNPDIIQCYKIFRKPHMVHGFGLINLVRSGDIEECTGGDAWQFVSSPPTDPQERLDRIRYLFRWARGLNAIHKKNLCHNDIKPSNLLLTTVNNRLEGKVGDLGALDAPNVPSGSTIPYVGPEYRKTNYGTKENDVHMFAVSMMQIMKGYAENPLKDLWSIDSDSSTHYIALEAKRQEYISSSDPIDQLLARMLHPDPTQRPTMEQVTQELERIFRLYSQDPL
jgi:hypothetical protein